MEIGIKPGAMVNAYYKDKWRPGTLMQFGRKWATVRINGAGRNSKVPKDAVRPILQPAPSAPAESGTAATPLPGITNGIHLEEFDSYLRLRDGALVIGVIPKAHRKIAEEIVTALKAWRALATQRGA